MSKKVSFRIVPCDWCVHCRKFIKTSEEVSLEAALKEHCEDCYFSRSVIVEEDEEK